MASNGPRARNTGTIGICAQETARYSEFAVCLANLRRPPGWEVKAAYGADVAFGRNRLAHEMTGEWMFYLDDDHAFAPDLLERLLAHNLDIVGPIVLKKHPPFPAAASLELGRSGLPGLREVDSMGSAGMLVHRSVFEAMEMEWPGEPYFQPQKEGETFLSEDLYFCHRALECGFELHVDTSVPMGHAVPAFAYPAYQDGEWQTALVMPGGQFVRVARDDVVEGDPVATLLGVA